MRRIGHKGADLIEPGNTLVSFDAAVAAGVDMIEFDVLPERAGDAESPLRLAHDYGHAVADAPTLDDGLAHLATLDVDLLVDLKGPGYESRVAAALREHDLVERSTVSTLYMRSLVALRALDPELRLSWSVPRVRRDYTANLIYALPAYALLRRLNRILPARAAHHIRDGRCDVLTAHWRLVTPRLVDAVHGAGGELYVWTVDDAAMIARVESLGADGVITNDPRLFQEIRQEASL